MRILFYGGCHASAMKRIVDQHGLDNRSASSLTNFTMIAREEPFPFERTLEFDLVVFSPITNKGNWNTNYLEEYCQAHNITFIKYPWIQWNGYFPGARKRITRWHSEWSYATLSDLAAKHTTFDSYYEELLEGGTLAQMAVQNLVETSEFLKQRESESRVDIPISGYIENNFRRSRLMLTPDHASTTLYQFIFRELERLVGVILDKSFYHTSVEVQQGILTPIIPSVARALELDFVGADYQNTEFSGSQVMPFRDFARMMFSNDDLFKATSRRRTRLKSPLASREQLFNVPEHESFIVQVLPSDRAGHKRAYILAAAGRSAKSSQLAGQEHLFYEQHWHFESAAPEAKPTA